MQQLRLQWAKDRLVTRWLNGVSVATDEGAHMCIMSWLEQEILILYTQIIPENVAPACVMSNEWLP